MLFLTEKRKRRRNGKKVGKRKVSKILWNENMRILTQTKAYKSYSQAKNLVILLLGSHKKWILTSPPIFLLNVNKMPFSAFHYYECPVLDRIPIILWELLCLVVVYDLIRYEVLFSTFLPSFFLEVTSVDISIGLLTDWCLVV